ncbi:MAG: NTP transferase domain-containing protein [Parcubacteria group bacterium]|nr:NTP transferase domain-containing protein [Parcubacteria group bacterium]
MQIVILAGGRGVRMGALTETTPKPMLMVAGKNLLQHKIDILPKEIDEVILVVGYLGEKIREFFGDNYNGKKIKYVVQKELFGTGDALWKTKDLINKKFLVMMGDDIYSKNDIEKCLAHDWAVLVKRSVDKICSGGKVILDKDGHIKDIIEGKHEGDNLLINAALYSLTPAIFKYPLVKIPGREEFGLPQTLLQAVDDFPIKVVQSELWLQMSNREDLKEAEKIIARNSEVTSH